VERELERGGQVYYVHNRVRTIDRAAQRVQRLVPRARIAVGHGQMEEDDLARVMVEFGAGRHDVLVCTTIIESGLDIPNGNTLGVEQHGAIAAVGFEMYLQMLQSAVARLRSGEEEASVEDVLSTPEMNLDLPLDHLIPRSYIRDERLRLGAYRQLADAEDETGLEAILASLRDRYGRPPAQLDNLVYSLRVKLRGQRLGLRAVVGDAREVTLRVDPDRP